MHNDYLDWKNSVDMQEGLRQMLGRVFVRVEGSVGDGEMTFVRDDGVRFVFHHFQDCCESVQIEDVVGDLQDLVGEPLLLAEEVSNADGPEPEYSDSYTWTFYKFATRRGYVDVRWLGESNGYYGEGVDLCVIREE